MGDKWRASIFYGVHIGTALLLGLLVYVFCGRDIRILKLAEQWLPLEYLPEAGNGIIQSFARNHLCDMAWAYALVFSVCLIWREEGSLGRITAGCMVFAGLSEFLQLAGILTRTFDIWDIVLEWLAMIPAAFLIKRHKEKRGGQYEKENNKRDSGYGGTGSISYDGGRKRKFGFRFSKDNS
ncbi:hypothetical protein BLA28_26355 [Eisenbergiella tayi]|uniref:hypothetical protein n=1 Tax=Eisenbergiella tayi TaxID=1432052 RepID=UPI0008405C7A|nr:hypothetical protein [Eisenbergiella tayi]OIZ60978.1 hypothetical protein BLA28_26355 [Eisenbergiella tayi]